MSHLHFNVHIEVVNACVVADVIVTPYNFHGFAVKPRGDIIDNNIVLLTTA